MLLREPVSPTSRVVRRPGVTVETSGSLLELVDAESGERIALSPAAGRLWELLDGDRTVADVAAAIGQPPIDVIELIRRLRAGGLAGDAPAHAAPAAG